MLTCKSERGCDVQACQPVIKLVEISLLLTQVLQISVLVSNFILG